MPIEYLENSKQFIETYSKIKNVIMESEKLRPLHNSIFKSIGTHELEYLSKAPLSLFEDYLLFRYEYHALATEKIKTKFPLYILIEPTSICNLRCVMCFQTDKSFGNNKEFMGKMDLGLLRSIIDQAVDGGTKAITFASRGEPTMHPNLDVMLDYVKGKFLEVKLNTNGLLLNDNLSRSILENEVTDLVFSIDSYERKNYEEIRKKAKFDHVVKNIERFIELRESEFPHHRTTVRVSGVKVDESQSKKRFNEFWGGLVDYNVLVDLQARWDTYNNDPLPPERLSVCGDLFERMYIWWDGKVNPCDVDYKSTLSVGDLKGKTIEEIWNGHPYSNLRDKHLAGLRGDFSTCARCDAWLCEQ